MEVEDGVPDIDVSRETFERLEGFVALVRKWNDKINLVSQNSLDDIWSRHIIDSIQVLRAAEEGRHWVDLGSGGGFPGVVIAILAAVEKPEMRVTLIESDQRKCAFLRTASRELGLYATVLCERIELAEPQDADVLSARALANLSQLIEYSNRHLSKGGLALFPKGITWQKEVEESRKKWRFDVRTIDSITEPGAVILKVKGASRV